MRFLTPATLLLSASLASAFPYDDGQADLSDELTLNGIETRTNGTVRTYNIPITNWPNDITFTARGGDGGRAKANSTFGDDKEAQGGGGVIIGARFDIHPTQEGSLRPGGEIRIIVGSRGETQSAPDNLAAGGGGGATGYLYRPPVDGADWELLLIAGGGGGAAASTSISQTYSSNGKNANSGTDGDDAGTGPSDGGTNGDAGDSWSNGAGGGAGWLDNAAGSQGGNRGTSGGDGGSPNRDGRDGGFGICAGGASYRYFDINNHQGGGGGGGGYSGGAAGDDDENNTTEEGGGGGSYVDSRETSQWAIERNGEELNGLAEVNFSTISSGSLSGPTITLTGDASMTLAFDQSYSDPGASAEDIYGNDLTVTTTIPSGLTNGNLGTFTVTYKATDQFGATTTVTRTVERISNQIPHSITLSNRAVDENTTAVATISATDPEGADVSFRIAEGSGDQFFEIINGNELVFKSALDFEDPKGIFDSNVYNVTLIANDGTFDSGRFGFGIDVEDVNEAPNAPSLSSTSINENTTTVGTLSGTDPEGDSLTYFISGGADRDLFQIVSGNTLAFINAPDFENPQADTAGNTYVVRLKANDGSFDSAAAQYAIVVQDVNEAPGSLAISNTTVSENTTTVGTFSATDPEGDSLTYTLVDGVDTEHFSITGNTLSFITPPDFENPVDNDGKNTYRAKLIASDGSLSTAETVFVIYITDVEETALEQFRSDYGLALDGSEDGGDLSGNGIPNVHYLAFDLGDPNEPNIDRSKLPIVEDGPTANTIRITYHWRNNVDLIYEVYRSHDLTIWTAESDFLEAEESISSFTTTFSDGYRTTSKVFPTPASDAECFYRLGVR